MLAGAIPVIYGLGIDVLAERKKQVLAQDLAQASLRRHVLFASLPHGTCVLVERLVARQALTVASIVQGHLSVSNDGYFGDHPDHQGQRRLFWNGGMQVTPQLSAREPMLLALPV